MATRRKNRNPWTPRLLVQCSWTIKPTSMWQRIKVLSLILFIRTMEFLSNFFHFSDEAVWASNFTLGSTLILLEENLNLQSLTSKSYKCGACRADYNPNALEAMSLPQGGQVGWRHQPLPYRLKESTHY